MVLFHRIRFIAPDAAVIIDFGNGRSVFIVRDIEMDRARETVRADQVCCAADFEPEGGLSGDRDTALAQAEQAKLAAEANAKAQEQASSSLDALISGVTGNGAAKDGQ